MNYTQFLDKVIDDGIKAAKKDYSQPSQKNKLEGSIFGFEQCRDKSPTEIAFLLIEYRKIISEERETEMIFEELDVKREHNYWYYRCAESEIEWVANVVSAMLYNEGKQTIITPTARGMMKADEILKWGLASKI